MPRERVPDATEQHFSQKLWRRAQEHLAHGGIDAAKGLLEALLLRQPGQFRARLLLTSIHLGQHRARDASTQALMASRDVPDTDCGAVAATVECLLRCGETLAARDLLARCDAQVTQPDAGEARMLARARQKLGDNSGALKLLDRALALGYDDADLRYARALQLQFHGQFDAARAEMRECLQQMPTYGRAALGLARLHKRQPDHARLEFVRTQLGRVPVATEEHAAFEFAAFEELESLGDYAAAFSALARGNDIMRKHLAAEARLTGDLVDGTCRVATRTFVHDPGLVAAAAPIPIFIVGLPRAGTTVLDRMLSNHPDVASAGERTDFPLQLRWCADHSGDQPLDATVLERLADLDYVELGRRYLEQTRWRAEGKSHYIDKLPPNYLLLGLIHRALPFAPILHITRDPVGVCFSNYKTLFGNSYAHSYDMQEMAAHHVLYSRLMAHWRDVMPDGFLQVDYARLVADPESTLSDIFRFCRLPPAAGCSDLTRNRGTVATMSSIQARDPLDARGIDGWLRYRMQLEPMKEVLAAAGVIAQP